MFDYSTTAPRTDEEIDAKIKSVDFDMFGTYTEDLGGLMPLDYLKANGFQLKDESAYTPDPRDPAAVVARIKNYLPFAWEKANNCRGLSAVRSIQHMDAWLWLLREDDVCTFMENEEFHSYGKPWLAAISERIGVDWKALDNGQWVDSEEQTGSRDPVVAKLPWRD